MDAQALLQEFLASPQGQQATAALQAQGVSPQDAQTYIAHATEVAHAHISEQGSSSLIGEHTGKNFFAALASGLVRGDGVWGSIKDGLEGTLSGRITEVIAQRAGIDPATASTIASALTPYISGFLKNKLGG